MLKFLESYLTERKQFIDFAGYTSTCENVETGVPQGSVLGPLFFLVYINNLQNNTTIKSKILLMIHYYTQLLRKSHIKNIMNTLTPN